MYHDQLSVLPFNVNLNTNCYSSINKHIIYLFIHFFKNIVLKRNVLLCERVDQRNCFMKVALDTIGTGTTLAGLFCFKKHRSFLMKTFCYPRSFFSVGNALLVSDHLSSATSFPKYQKFPSQITTFETSCNRPPLVSDRDHFYR